MIDEIKQYEGMAVEAVLAAVVAKAEAGQPLNAFTGRQIGECVVSALQAVLGAPEETPEAKLAGAITAISRRAISDAQ